MSGISIQKKQDFLPNQDPSKAWIVAEAEINHNGDFSTALKMVDVARECGADAIKFQYIVAEEIATRESPFFSFFKKVELTHNEFEQIFAHAKRAGISCFTTVPSVGCLERALELVPPLIKIGSTNLTNIPLLEAVGRAGVPVILSTGLGTLGEIESALQALDYPGTPVSLLHCTVNYPAPFDSLNLRAITTMKAAFPALTVGFSDHTEGERAAAAARALGAMIFEKHFTLDRSQEGPDHSFSTDPSGFRWYVQALRETELALGDGIKRAAVSEANMIRSGRRYVVAAKAIPRGKAIEEEDLTCRRIPADREGIEPVMIKRLKGWKAPKDYKPGDSLSWEDFRA